MHKLSSQTIAFSHDHSLKLQLYYLSVNFALSHDIIVAYFHRNDTGNYHEARKHTWLMCEQGVH